MRPWLCWCLFLRRAGQSARKSKDLDRLKEIETLASQGRTDEAIAAYQQFVKDYPKSDSLGTAYLALGKLYITKKDYDQALKAFSHVIAASKQSSEKEEASLLMGKIYFTQKKYQDANDSLQGVFKNAHDQKMKTEMANVLFQSNRQLGKYQQAVFWLGQYSLAAEPKDAERARAVLPDIIPKLSDAEIAQTLKAEGPDWMKGRADLYARQALF